MVSSKHIGIIILAAGSSSRLGQPKQLLPYAGTTLLQHAIFIAKESVAQAVIVVLGAHADKIKEAIEWGKTEIVMNTDWQEGMASSIRCGVDALVKRHPLTEGAILMLSDQPYVDAALQNSLIRMHEATGKAIIASSYKDTIGVPAFFQKRFFPHLLDLEGETGAKYIIQRHIADVATVAFSKGNVDIDTAADYKALRQAWEQ